MAPFKAMTTKEVCDRYGISRYTLCRKIRDRKFPSPTGKCGSQNVWDVRVLESYEQKMLKLSESSWDPSLVAV